MERTTNGSFGSQDALCAAEGGQAATRFDIVNLKELEYYCKSCFDVVVVAECLSTGRNGVLVSNKFPRKCINMLKGTHLSRQ